MQSQRLWIDGALNAADEIDTAELAARLRSKAGDGDSFAWIDLTRESTDTLTALERVLGLHELAVEDALNVRERQKVTRFDSHVLFRAINATLGDDSSVRRSGLAAIITPQVVITVRDDDFPIDAVHERLEGNAELARHGPGYVVWAILDVVVDSVMDVLEVLDDRTEQLSAVMFDRPTAQQRLQQEAFVLRRGLSHLRHVAVPMRDMVCSMGRRDTLAESAGLEPYLADVMDHAIHGVEWIDSLRDDIDTVLETNIALQGNRMNETMKKVTSWAAIIAVPTLVTGFFGQNLLFWGLETVWGAWLSVGLILVSSLILYWQFRRRDWL